MKRSLAKTRRLFVAEQKEHHMTQMNDRQFGRGVSRPTRIDTLTVPGARLYYEVRGSGPVLLLIPGAGRNAESFAGIAGRLADRYTVVTYDPRDRSRSSSIGAAEEDWRADIRSDDASHLLAAFSQGPALVFGSSEGAQVGLDLAARHPDKVSILIAHEPPAIELLPDAAEYRALCQEVYDTYVRDGVGPAMAKHLAVWGLEAPPPNAAPPQGAPNSGMAHLEHFLAHGVRQISAYVPDVTTLQAGSPRVIVAVGDASRGLLADRCGVALAERLGITVRYFPGDHGGYATHPDAFAETLHQVISSR
jgi:pimeloyl-ACP methyl ester carboxylesterase